MKETHNGKRAFSIIDVGNDVFFHLLLYNMYLVIQLCKAERVGEEPDQVMPCFCDDDDVEDVHELRFSYDDVEDEFMSFVSVMMMLRMSSRA